MLIHILGAAATRAMSIVENVDSVVSKASTKYLPLLYRILLFCLTGL